jgi:hypothetical protein
VDDTIVGEDIDFHSLSVVEKDSGVADRDLDSSALKSVDSETVEQFTRDKDAREDVVEKDIGQSLLSLVTGEESDGCGRELGER